MVHCYRLVQKCANAVAFNRAAAIVHRVVMNVAIGYTECFLPRRFIHAR